MAQTPSERRAAQRKLAKDLKAGKRIFTGKEKGQVKAARVLKYRMSTWNAMPPAERKDLREFVAGRQGSIKRFAARPQAERDKAFTEDWETWEWDMYKEAVAK